MRVCSTKVLTNSWKHDLVCSAHAPTFRTVVHVRVAHIRILFSCDLSFVRMPKNSAHHQSLLVISHPSCFRDCFHGLCKTVPHAVSHYVDIAYSFDCVLYLDMARKHILSSGQLSRCAMEGNSQS